MTARDLNMKLSAGGVAHAEWGVVMAGGRARSGVGARSDKENPKSVQMGKFSLVFSHLEPFAF